MSLLATAKANKLEPTKWLEHTLERLRTTKAQDGRDRLYKRIDDF